MSLVLMKHYKLMLAIRCYFKLHPIYEEVCLFIYLFYLFSHNADQSQRHCKLPKCIS